MMRLLLGAWLRGAHFLILLGYKMETTHFRFGADAWFLYAEAV
jgi:hypothetical protein